MEIVALFKGENQPLVDLLKKASIRAESAQGRVMMWFPYRREGGIKIYDLNLPYALNPKILYLHCYEYGGAGRSMDGAGSVICNLNGEKLMPYQIFNPPINDAQAYFLVPSAVATVTAYRDKNIKIREYRIRQKGIKAWIDIKELWCNKLGRLPGHLQHFHRAVLAASAKSSCALCSCVHYATELATAPVAS